MNHTAARVVVLKRRTFQSNYPDRTSSERNLKAGTTLWSGLRNSSQFLPVQRPNMIPLTAWEVDSRRRCPISCTITFARSADPCWSRSILNNTKRSCISSRARMARVRHLLSRLPRLPPLCPTCFLSCRDSSPSSCWHRAFVRRDRNHFLSFSLCPASTLSSSDPCTSGGSDPPPSRCSIYVKGWECVIKTFKLRRKTAAFQL